MQARAPSGSLSGKGAHSWLARSSSQAPCRVRYQSMPKPARLATLWQAGFRNTTCAIGTHLTPLQFQQLSEQPDRPVYIVFDQDENQAGQLAAHHLALRLAGVGVPARVVQLPAGHDPNSYFVAGATAAEFSDCLERAQQL